MNIFSAIIRKLFLVKEIVSKKGELHFRRYRLLQTPWFAIYIHHICRSDEDTDPHDHPWHFQSFMLSGSYMEMSRLYPNFNAIYYQHFHEGDVIKRHAEDVHKITLMTPEVWTLVFTSGREREWGYRLNGEAWIDHKSYRQLKNEGKLR